MSLQYYVTFKDAQGNPVTIQGETLLPLTSFSLGSNGGTSSSGGKADLGPLNLTVGESALTVLIDKMLASGQAFHTIDIIGAVTPKSGYIQPVVQYEFKNATPTTDTSDIAGGAHTVGFTYDALVERTWSDNNGLYQPSYTYGWNQKLNLADDAISNNFNALTTPGKVRTGFSGSLFVRIEDVNGNALVSANNGWVKLSGADLTQTRSGGKVVFSPVTLDFADGAMDPTLLRYLTAGSPLKIEVASVSSSGQLSDDVRFGTAFLTSQGVDIGNGTSYTFQAGQTYSSHYDYSSNGTATVTGEGWDAIKNVSISSNAPTLPTQMATPTALPSVPASDLGALSYDIRFITAGGQAVSADGSSVYQLSSAQFQALISGLSGDSFAPLTLTLGSSDLTAYLDGLLTSGTTLAAVDIYATQAGATGKPVVVAQDEIKNVTVASDQTDAASGLHALGLSYTALVERFEDPANPAGETLSGWNLTTNKPDTQLVGPTSLPSDKPVLIGGTDASKTQVYVRILNNGTALPSGATGGWVQVDAASFSPQTSQSRFAKLDLTLGASTLDPQLQLLLAEGADRVSLELATYAPGNSGAPTLVEDVQLGDVTLSGSSSAVGGTGDTTYSFEAPLVFDTHLETVPGAPSTQSWGWDYLTSKPLAKGAPGLPGQQAAPDQAPKAGPTGYPAGEKFFVSFTSATNGPLSPDGGKFYEISAAQYKLIGAQAGVAGTSTPGPVSLDLGPSLLTEALDKMMANSQTLAEIDVFAATPAQNGSLTPLQQIEFQNVTVAGDSVSSGLGDHTFSFDYTAEAQVVNEPGLGGIRAEGGWNWATNQMAAPRVSDAVDQYQVVTTAEPPAVQQKLYLRLVLPSGYSIDPRIVAQDLPPGLSSSDGWIDVSGADLQLQKPNAVAGPVSLSGLPADLQPLLLELNASGAAFGLEIAAYTGSGASKLVDDYRLGVTFVSSIQSSTSPQSTDITYVLAPGEIAGVHYSGLSSASWSWNNQTASPNTKGLPPQLAPAPAPPAAPAITALVGQPVNGARIEVSGTGVAGDTVTLYADGGQTAVGSGVVASNGTFDITTTATFADGIHSLTATQTYAGLTSKPSTAFSVAVDPTAPAITALVGQPVNGSTVEVSGTGEAGDTVTLYADGGQTAVGSGVVASNGTFDITTTASFADGLHSLTATATDAAGLTSALSAGFQVSVDPTAPAITALVGQPVNGSTVEVRGTGEAGDTITLYADGGQTAVGSGVVASNGTFDITTTATFADGLHSLTATATDAAGLTSALSAGFQVSVDPTAPAITALVGQPVNGLPVEVRGSAEAGDTITLYADGGANPVGSGVVASDGTFDITTTVGFADGILNLTATATDGAGLTSAPSAGFQVAVDPNAPAIGALVGQPVNGSTVEVKGTGEVGDTITLYADGGQTAVGSGVVASDGTFDITTTASFADGAHSLTATATDGAGLTSAPSLAFSLSVDPTAPVIAAVAGKPVSGAPIEVRGTGEAGDAILLYADGGPTPVGSGVVGSDGTFDITTSAVFAEGLHSLTATATDGAGLISAASAGFQVDVRPPGQTYVLTPGVDIFTGGGGDNTVIGTATTLSTGDRIDGGVGGTNTLQLQGGGVFTLAKPATLTDIQVVQLYEGQAASGAIASTEQVVNLRAGMNATVQVAADPAYNGANPNPDAILILGAADSDTIRLGGGADTVILGSSQERVVGGAGAGVVDASSVTLGAMITGGTGGLTLNIGPAGHSGTGGGAVALNSADTGVTAVNLLATHGDWSLTTNAEAGLQVSDRNTAWADTITLGGAGQSVTGGGAGKDTFVLSAAGGDTVLDTAVFLNGDTVAGFQSGDVVNVTDLIYAQLAGTFTENAAGTGGQLALSDGVHQLSINFTGSFLAAGASASLTAAGFTASSAASGVAIGYSGA